MSLNGATALLKTKLRKNLIKDLTDVPNDTCVKLLELLDTCERTNLALLQEAFWFVAKLPHQTKLENHSE